ncbi:hypothetical protein LXL04_012477 [Taraxacum kok-saghyz]
MVSSSSGNHHDCIRTGFFLYPHGFSNVSRFYRFRKRLDASLDHLNDVIERTQRMRNGCRRGHRPLSGCETLERNAYGTLFLPLNHRHATVDHSFRHIQTVVMQMGRGFPTNRGYPTRTRRGFPALTGDGSGMGIRYRPRSEDGAGTVNGYPSGSPYPVGIISPRTRRGFDGAGAGMGLGSEVRDRDGSQLEFSINNLKFKPRKNIPAKLDSCKTASYQKKRNSHLCGIFVYLLVSQHTSQTIPILKPSPRNFSVFIVIPYQAISKDFKVQQATENQHERVDGELTDFVDLEDRTKKSRVRASGNLLSTQQKGESVELSTRAMMAGDSCSFRPPASASSLPSFCRCELRRSAASSVRVRVKKTSRLSLHLSPSFHLSDLGSASDSCRLMHPYEIHRFPWQREENCGMRNATTIRI